jgi:hypothetical protein
VTGSVVIKNQGKYYSKCVKIGGLLENSEQRQMENVVTKCRNNELFI